MLLFRLTTKTCQHNYLCTCPQMYPFMTLPVHFILSFRLTVKIYPSTFLHVHRCTCSSLYLFSLFLLFRHNLHNDLSSHLLGYLHRDPPENKFTPMLLFRLTIKTYLSRQLLVYLPIDVPVHDPTCSFSLSRSTRQRFYCSPCPHMYMFITIPVQFISSFSA